jgi:hypothetical protein
MIAGSTDANPRVTGIVARHAIWQGVGRTQYPSLALLERLDTLRRVGSGKSEPIRWRARLARRAGTRVRSGGNVMECITKTPRLAGRNPIVWIVTIQRVRRIDEVHNFMKHDPLQRLNKLLTIRNEQTVASRIDLKFQRWSQIRVIFSLTAVCY